MAAGKRPGKGLLTSLAKARIEREEALGSVLEPWDDRVVEHGYEAPDQLLFNPLNWKIHPRGQQEAFKGVVRDVGFIRSVTVNRRTGRLLDGHLRVKLAADAGVARIPVEYVDIPEELEAEAIATFDTLAMLSVPDPEKLKEVVEAVETDQESVRFMLAQLEKNARPAYEFLDDLDDDEDGDGEDGSRSERDKPEGRYPLPIVLDLPTYRRWMKFKESRRVRSDTQAFLLLLDAADGGGDDYDEDDE